MSDTDFWNRIRPAPYDDDPPERAELAAEIGYLRRELADVQGHSNTVATQEQPSTMLHAEVRRLTASVEAMRAALPPMLATIPDAAEALGVSISTVRRSIKSGDLPTRRLGRSVRVDLSRCRGLDGDDIARLARAARGGR